MWLIVRELSQLITFEVLKAQKELLNDDFTKDNTFKAGIAFGIGACLGVVLRTLADKDNG